MSNCERDEDGRVVDPITMDQVPEERVISFEQFGTTFCFDIDSLANATEQGRDINPMNRQPLPREVIEQIQLYRRINNIRIALTRATTGTQHTITTTRTTPIGDIIIQIHRELHTTIGSDITISWRGGEASGTLQSLYNFPLGSTLRDIIGNSTDVTSTVNNIPNSSGYIEGLEDRYAKLYRYARSIGRMDIVNSIPERYRPYIPDAPDTLIMEILSEFVLDNRDKPDQYIIVGLSKLLAGAKIMARFANALHRGVAIRANNSLASWLEVLHLLYSRVIDPSNLNKNIPIQGQYYLDAGVRPTFTSKYNLIRQGIREGGNQRSPPAPVPRIDQAQYIMQLLQDMSRRGAERSAPIVTGRESIDEAMDFIL